MGAGKLRETVSPNGCRYADAQRAGKIPVARERRVGGILHEIAEEAGAGADGCGRGADIHGAEGALRGVRGIIAVIANVGCAELGNQRGLVEERHFFRGNVQVADGDFAEDIAEQEGGARSDLVGELDVSFVARLAEGVDVLRFFDVGICLQAQFRNVKGVRRVVSKQRASLDGASREVSARGYRRGRSHSVWKFPECRAARPGFLRRWDRWCWPGAALRSRRHRRSCTAWLLPPGRQCLFRDRCRWQFCGSMVTRLKTPRL